MGEIAALSRNFYCLPASSSSRVAPDIVFLPAGMLLPPTTRVLSPFTTRGRAPPSTHKRAPPAPAPFFPSAAVTPLSFTPARLLLPTPPPLPTIASGNYSESPSSSCSCLRSYSASSSSPSSSSNAAIEGGERRFGPGVTVGVCKCDVWDG